MIHVKRVKPAMLLSQPSIHTLSAVPYQWALLARVLVYGSSCVLFGGVSHAPMLTSQKKDKLLKERLFAEASTVSILPVTQKK